MLVEIWKISKTSSDRAGQTALEQTIIRWAVDSDPQVKRFNVRQAIDQQEISSFFMLVPKEE